MFPLSYHSPLNMACFQANAGVFMQEIRQTLLPTRCLAGQVNYGGKGGYPLPRQGHVSVFCDDHLIVFGGRTDGVNRQRR
jgi:hypothetical protein